MDYLVTTQIDGPVALLVSSVVGMVLTFRQKEWEGFCVLLFLALVGAVAIVYRLLGGA